MEAGLFDLSIGARVLLAATVGALLEPSLGLLGLIIGCFVGGMAGAMGIATLYRLLRLPSMVLAIGIVLIYEILATMMGGAVALLRISSASAAWGSYPFNVLIAIGACVLSYFILYKTKIGCLIKAVGNDEAMAINMGINANRVKVTAYLLGGIFCGITGFLLVSVAAGVSMQTGMSTLTMVFQPMIGVFIGLQLKRVIDNLPLLIFIGQISLTIIFNGFIALGVTDHIQRLFLGLFLITVMVVSANADKWREKNEGLLFNLRLFRKSTRN
jgi:ribose transport system permease protein